MREVEEIRENINFFYGEQLYKSGLIGSLEQAIKEARWECELYERNKDSAQQTSYWLLKEKDSGEDIGYLVYFTKDSEGYLDAIFLKEKWRGQGLGRIVLTQFEDKMRELGMKSVKLYVFAYNTAAFTLYSHSGYIIEESYFAENRIIGYHMRKEF